MSNIPRRLRPARVVLVACLVVAACLPSSALADGGQSIASAPTAVYGQQEFGNTATGLHIPDTEACFTADEYRSYWLVNVAAGDRLTLDWESQVPNTELFLFPNGTNDFNVDNTNWLAQQELNASGGNEVVLTSPTNGTLPFYFRVCADPGGTTPGQFGPPGPYDFTAYVRHLVRLAWPRVSKLPHKTTLKIGVHNADGGPLSDPNLVVEVQIRSHGAWLGVGFAPVVGSVAKVPVRIPFRFLSATIRAVAHGGSYQTATTRNRTVLLVDRAKAKRRKTGRR